MYICTHTQNCLRTVHVHVATKPRKIKAAKSTVAISTGPARLLIVRFYAFWQGPVHNKPIVDTPTTHKQQQKNILQKTTAKYNLFFLVSDTPCIADIENPTLTNLFSRNRNVVRFINDANSVCTCMLEILYQELMLLPLYMLLCTFALNVASL